MKAKKVYKSVERDSGLASWVFPTTITKSWRCIDTGLTGSTRPHQTLWEGSIPPTTTKSCRIRYTSCTDIFIGQIPCYFALHLGNGHIAGPPSLTRDLLALIIDLILATEAEIYLLAMNYYYGLYINTNKAFKPKTTVDHHIKQNFKK